MKAKLRKITCFEETFLYGISATYIQQNTIEKEHYITTLKVFRKDHKTTPFQLILKNATAYPTGNIATMGVTTTFNDSPIEFNLNRPGIVRIIIENAIKEGWNWNNEAYTIDEGIDFLKKIGFKTKNIIAI